MISIPQASLETYQVWFVVRRKFLRPLSKFVPLIEQTWSSATASTMYPYSSFPKFLTTEHRRQNNYFKRPRHCFEVKLGTFRRKFILKLIWHWLTVFHVKLFKTLTFHQLRIQWRNKLQLKLWRKLRQNPYCSILYIIKLFGLGSYLVFNIFFSLLCRIFSTMNWKTVSDWIQ